MKKIVSIVVTYNGIRWIEKCLTSLTTSAFATGIVVIDNGSTDNTVPFIKQNFSSVILIESKENLGFGQANNKGIQLAIEKKADYVFLLNQDAWIETATIGCLVTEFENSQGYGIISPLHLNGAGNAFDKYFLDYFMQAGVTEDVTSDILVDKSQNLLIKVPFVNAAAWCISIECIKATGGFDPVFFHYGEDRNYIQRALYRGFKIGIFTGARIFHDREQRLMRAIKLDEHFNREWIHFLNQACDVGIQKYRQLVTKRFLRYSFLAGINLITFNKRSFSYHYKMALKIFSNTRRIKESRMIAVSNTAFPHLTGPL